MNGEEESRRTKPHNEDDHDDNGDDDRFTLRRHSPSMKIEAGDILGTMLVETANIFNNFNFNWPAGLHLWSNYKSSSSSTTTTTTSWTFFYLRLSLLDCWPQYPWSFVGGTSRQNSRFAA
ncbi:unnamed protein product [Porites evermanni]|uniref:Uncharacterized protein n=1 Tax=Porites evermanni TaxID=104178 RepID=A0ABN8LF90_9CNID|nr:unnamed protein product [Porites evermanni]